MNQPCNVINHPQAVVRLWINWHNLYLVAIASHWKPVLIAQPVLQIFFYLASSHCLHCLVAYDNTHIVIILQNPLSNESQQNPLPQLVTHASIALKNWRSHRLVDDRVRNSVVGLRR